jgi:predicted AlkP superfamily phosphohydrolase/phosphomutase
VVPLKRDTLERQATLNWLLVQWLQAQRGLSGLTEKALRRMIRVSLLNLPGRIQSWPWKRLEAIFPRAQERVFFNGQPDYSRTQLFAGSAYAGLLYFNLAGREATGVVPHEARDALASEIATKLRKIEDPETGQPIFSNVYTATDLYTGSAVAHAPDVILDSYDSGWNIRTRDYTIIPGQTRHKYFVEAGRGRDFGWHSRDGIFVFSGQDFSVGSISWAAQLMDVPATLLHLYDVPVPEDYDGRVLREFLQAELGERPVRYQSGDTLESGSSYDAYSADEAEEVLGHLRALGYLD